MTGTPPVSSRKIWETTEEIESVMREHRDKPEEMAAIVCITTRHDLFEISVRSDGKGSLYNMKQRASTSSDMTDPSVKLAMKRFVRECMIATSDKKYTVPVHSWGFPENQAYIITEFCPYGTLDLFLANETTEWDYTDLLIAIIQLVRCKEVLHNNGFIHRSIKPKNIMMDQGKYPIFANLESARDGNSPRQSMSESLFWAAPEIVEAAVEHYSEMALSTGMGAEPTDIFETKASYRSDDYAIGLVIAHLIAKEPEVESSDSKLWNFEDIEKREEDRMKWLTELTVKNVSDRAKGGSRQFQEEFIREMRGIMCRLCSRNPEDRLIEGLVPRLEAKADEWVRRGMLDSKKWNAQKSYVYRFINGQRAASNTFEALKEAARTRMLFPMVICFVYCRKTGIEMPERLQENLYERLEAEEKDCLFCKGPTPDQTPFLEVAIREISMALPASGDRQMDDILKLCNQIRYVLQNPSRPG